MLSARESLPRGSRLPTKHNKADQTLSILGVHRGTGIKTKSKEKFTKMNNLGVKIVLIKC